MADHSLTSDEKYYSLPNMSRQESRAESEKGGESMVAVLRSGTDPIGHATPDPTPSRARIPESDARASLNVEGEPAAAVLRATGRRQPMILLPMPGECPPRPTRRSSSWKAARPHMHTPLRQHQPWCPHMHMLPPMCLHPLPHTRRCLHSHRRPRRLRKRVNSHTRSPCTHVPFPTRTRPRWGLHPRLHASQPVGPRANSPTTTMMGGGQPCQTPP